MGGLKVWLWIAGLFCLSAIVGVFAPMSLWPKVTGFFGVETLPDAPVFVYFARLLSVTSGGIGIFFIVLALRPAKYGVLVPFSGIMSVLIGLTALITGIIVQMPAKWYLCDSLPCIILGILILAFWPQAKSAAVKASQVAKEV
jgi:hypothetical protein